MVAIVPSWSDARLGALVNFVALVGVVFGAMADGPGSLRAAYEQDVERALARLTRWMRFKAEQYNFYDEPARFFYMDASMFLVPVQGFHRYASTSAAMRVKAAALVPVLDMSELR